MKIQKDIQAGIKIISYKSYLTFFKAIFKTNSKKNQNWTKNKIIKYFKSNSRNFKMNKIKFLSNKKYIQSKKPKKLLITKNNFLNK